MNILLDTHVLIWLTMEKHRLSQPALQAIGRATQSGELVIADITLWETAMLIEKGRIQINTDCESFLQLALDAYDVQVRPITPKIATQSVQLPRAVNKDPSDRIIVATAIVEQLSLITADGNLQQYKPLKVIW